MKCDPTGLRLDPQHDPSRLYAGRVSSRLYAGRFPSLSRVSFTGNAPFEETLCNKKTDSRSK